MGATNELGRIAAMAGKITEVPIVFEGACDVPYGGVLLALPALLVTGLLAHSRKYFKLPGGYYGLESLFLLMAFMSLVRIKSVEQLRYCSPVEWGKLLGLDRIPEVRTLREKLKILSDEGHVAQWGAQLSKEWMRTNTDDTGLFYIDGHVRVYHGHQTKLPRHYVARQRLCLRATTDYWVNAMDGQPFFYINQAVDPGLIQVVENEIVPRLKTDAPNQPTQEALNLDPYRPQFTLIFDREGYSPGLMKRLNEQNIACLTYHKYPGDDWPLEEFSVHTVKLISGEKVEMSLAERGVYLQGGKIWVREIRKLTESGHQTSVLSTHYGMELTQICRSMFARWSQENFFRYMRLNYNIDALMDYYIEDITDTTQVVNPEYRQLDSKIRSLNSKLTRQLSLFGESNLKANIEPKKVERYEQ